MAEIVDVRPNGFINDVIVVLIFSDLKCLNSARETEVDGGEKPYSGGMRCDCGLLGAWNMPLDSNQISGRVRQLNNHSSTPLIYD